ncbi:alpha/beta hydrolase [Sedimentitalea sp. JM2-8]|uniref:Alpha/beta hydrolase n=1 Tax=Sedimentitalea xiamensis TaxID=3050037 RepID=A0ABT7FJB7_9RHOB|nr:alpha/beta hydrolase [Sedimentitalea xiamensis]MDK3075120.1 alpha/beta hydrolase [Sedimentitalea xiamensis]
MSLSLIFWLVLALVAGLLALSVHRTRGMAKAAARMVPQAGEIVPVRGGRIHYVAAGPTGAPPVVLIHGLSGQLQHFTYAMAELLAGDFRVIAVDRPGCGYSVRDGAELATPGEQGRMIAEALAALGVTDPILVGHSFGGAVALAMAMDRPEQVRGLALLAPATQPQAEVPEVFRGLMVRTGWLRRAIGATVAVPLAAATAEKVLAAVFAPEPAPGDFMIRAGGALGLRPQAFVTASEDAVALLDGGAGQAARYAAELTVPGGILFGSADAILSPALHGHTMAAHGLGFETLEGRGHMIPLTAPRDCADFVRRVAAMCS